MNAEIAMGPVCHKTYGCRDASIDQLFSDKQHCRISLEAISNFC